jgi:phosphoribosylanthranilate isomerase
MAVRVKICGITRVDDARLAASMGADFIGLNFYPGSPRYLQLEQALEICRAVRQSLPPAIVGVFVNAERDFIAERVERLQLDLIQFHGDEEESALQGWPVPTIRAIRLKRDAPVDLTVARHADFILFDSFDPARYGGTGVQIELERLTGINLERVFLSGGLTAANVAAVAAVRPYAVDVASGVERSPGVKDESKMRSFITNAKSTK